MAQIIKLEAGQTLSPEQLAAVSGAVKACRIVVFPTDTVYGLGSTALVKAAARRIYQLKERSTLKPLPVLVHSAKEAQKWVEWTPEAEALARRFWPGALTLVLRPTAEGRLLTFAEYQTVAIRVPNHPALLQMIEASGVPWVSTSANRSGSAALSDPAEVIAQFADAVDIIVDSGRAPGIESTLVDAVKTPVRVLREGALSSAAVLAAAQYSA